MISSRDKSLASALGNLRANLVSTLFVSATSTVTDAVLIYSLESGSLPPGLTLTVDGQNLAPLD